MVEETGRRRYKSPPDGGFGWVIVTGSFVAMFIIFGYPRNLGLFIKPMVVAFETTTGPIGSIASMPVGLLFMTGPISGVLCKRFGSRSVGLVGGISVSIGLGIAFSTKSLFYLTIGLGILPGLGFGLIFTAIVTITSRYFDETFAVANGIEFLGGPVSFIICPILGEFLIAEYGWRRTLLIASGFALHLVVCASLMRPIHLQRDTEENDGRSEYELMENNDQPSTSQEDSLLNNTEATRNSGFKKLKDAAIYIELNLFLENAMFVLITVVIFLNGFAYEAWLIYLIPQAEELHVSRDTAATIFTITGVGSVVGRTLQIGILRFKILTPYNLWIFANVLAAVALILDPIYHNVTSLTLFSVIYGVATGIKLPLTPVLIRNNVGIDSMHVAFGWTNLARGLGALIGGTSIGYLRAILGSYRVPFIFVAIIQCFAVFALFCRPLVSKRDSTSQSPL